MTLILIRGLPGSGKSTLASGMTGFLHLEADQFLMIDGKYVYDKSKVKDAHKWCQDSTFEALKRGEKVVVSNTFCKLWEIEIYLKMGFETQIIEVIGNYQNIHGVPPETIQSMRDRWEPLTLGLKQKYRLSTPIQSDHESWRVTAVSAGSVFR